MLETRESGLAFIQAVNQIVGLVKLQQTKTGRKPLETYLASLSDAIATLEEKWEYLELHAPEDALDAARELLKACLSLMIPAEDAEGTSRDLGEVNRRRHDFINVLRQASGVNPISKNIPDPIVRRKFVEDNSEMLTVIYERLRKI